MTPAGIEPATFRFVAQHLNHCATAVPKQQQVEKESYVFLDMWKFWRKGRGLWLASRRQCLVPSCYFRNSSPPPVLLDSADDDPNDQQVSFISINVARLGTTYDVTSEDGEPFLSLKENTYDVGPVVQSVYRLTTGWTVRDRIPVGTRFPARPDRPCVPPSLL